MKYTIVASCLLVSAYAQAVRPDVCDGDAKARERTTPPQVRVMTYNVRYSAGDRKSKDNNWKARRGDFARVVEREAPDVVGFQEVLPDQRQPFFAHVLVLKAAARIDHEVRVAGRLGRLQRAYDIGLRRTAALRTEQD